ncbi:PEP-CTERM sorting domain-containing protein [Geobacter sp.]
MTIGSTQPEPSTWLLMSLGLVMALGWNKRLFGA